MLSLLLLLFVLLLLSHSFVVTVVVLDAVYFITIDFAVVYATGLIVITNRVAVVAVWCFVVVRYLCVVILFLY